MGQPKHSLASADAILLPTWCGEADADLYTDSCFWIVLAALDSPHNSNGNTRLAGYSSSSRCCWHWAHCAAILSDTQPRAIFLLGELQLLAHFDANKRTVRLGFCCEVYFVHACRTVQPRLISTLNAI